MTGKRWWASYITGNNTTVGANTTQRGGVWSLNQISRRNRGVSGAWATTLTLTASTWTTVDATSYNYTNQSVIAGPNFNSLVCVLVSASATPTNVVANGTTMSIIVSQTSPQTHIYMMPYESASSTTIDIKVESGGTFTRQTMHLFTLAGAFGRTAAYNPVYSTLPAVTTNSTSVSFTVDVPPGASVLSGISGLSAGGSTYGWTAGTTLAGFTSGGAEFITLFTGITGNSSSLRLGHTITCTKSSVNSSLRGFSLVFS